MIKTFISIIISILLMFISIALFLEISKEQNGFGIFSPFLAATCAIPSSFFCLSLIFFKKAFVDIDILSWGFDHFIRNILLAFPTAFGLYFLFTFLSPPLPFMTSLTCATNWNDPTILMLSGIFFLLRYFLRRKSKKHDNHLASPDPEPQGGLVS